MVVASFITVGNVSAQTDSVQATVPFNFSVGSTVLPSGTYIINSETPEVVMVRNKDHWNLAKKVLITPGNPQYAGVGKLVFEKYGDEYFLNEILCPSAAIIADLPTSKREDRARTREAGRGRPEQVLLALK